LLRHVGETTATVWVQTDGPADVEVLGRTARTFSVCGHYFALVEITGLRPGSATPYEVRVDGDLAWPLRDSRWPQSVIRTRGDTGSVQVVFGSCRHAEPDDPKAAAGLGVDSVRVYARRMATLAPEEWPDALLLLGDQVYADDPSPQTRRWLRTRRKAAAEPQHEVTDFTEYVRLYRDTWSDPESRWLLSTVPVAMIFDDHDVRDDWNTSEAWRRELTAMPWWTPRIEGALASYWVFQHIGNLSAEERATDKTWRAVRDCDGDAWPILREMAAAADRDAAGMRWSFRWEINRVRLVMVDTRAGRVLAEGQRSMLDEEEFAWVEDAVSADAAKAEHVLVGSSLPWLLPPAIHDVQSANELACSRGSRLGERIRQGFDLEHWAAFRKSFDRFGALLSRVAAGRDAPATISVLSGDVHHNYVARARFHGQTGSPVYQLVSSPVHHTVPWYARGAMRVSWFGPVAWVVRRLVRRFGVEDPALSWERMTGPFFGNALATAVFHDRGAELVIENTKGAYLATAARLELGPR
jgi:phosphodiesterase/alkaline phosphatase D-like protein